MRHSHSNYDINYKISAIKGKKKCFTGLEDQAILCCDYIGMHLWSQMTNPGRDI